MSETKKRNIIIGSLCGVLLLMVVGYAAFNTLLNIEGTTSITSNWDIKITEITSKDIVGGASDAESQVVDDLTATFKTNLVSPGDSITYYITVKNEGNIDAEVARVKLSDPDNEAITFETKGISEGDILTASSSHILTVKVTYSDEVTKQPENLEANLTVTLDYVEKGKKSEWTPNDTVYAAEMLIKKVTTKDDGLYEDTYEDGRYVYRGTNPDNYITFNGENAGWRIVSVESDGTIKIMKKTYIDSRVFDSSNARTTGYCSYANSYACNVWAQTANYDNYSNLSYGIQGNVSKDSELKTYLNDKYYNTITINQNNIENHNFYYGPVKYNNENLSEQILSEKKYFTKSYIGLIQMSDYIKANSNNSCMNWKAMQTNLSTCKNTVWMAKDFPSGSDTYTLNPMYGYYSNKVGSSYIVCTYGPTGGDGNFGHYAYVSSNKVVPAIYLKSDTVLDGEGTLQTPYTIKSSTS